MASSPSFLEIRKDIVGFFNPLWVAAYPAVPVEYENEEQVDVATFRGPYLCVDMVMGDGETFSVGRKPLMRVEGSVLFHVHAPQFTGMNTTYGYISTITDLLCYKQLPTCFMNTPKITPSEPVDSWLVTTLAVSFYADVVRT